MTRSAQYCVEVNGGNFEHSLRNFNSKHQGKATKVWHCNVNFGKEEMAAANCNCKIICWKLIFLLFNAPFYYFCLEAFVRNC
jgi:hypothetical protein